MAASDPILARRLALGSMRVADLAAETSAVGALSSQDLVARMAGSGEQWASGVAMLRGARLSFIPDPVQLMVRGRLAVETPLRSIARVEVFPGPVLAVIHITIPAGVLRLQCRGAEEFADQIRGAARASWPTG
ncbi:MAG: hypothetical protein ACK5KO_07090 [Arachnia sp.]